METCVNCGKMTPGRMFKLSRFKHYGAPMVPVSVIETKKGAVPLCDDCYTFFRRGNIYRVLGFIVIIAGLLLGSALANVIGLNGLLLWPISLVVGLFLLIRGRGRIAALEKRVGF